MKKHPGLIAFLPGFAPQNATGRTSTLEEYPSPYESKCVYINKHGGSHRRAQDELMQTLDYKLKTSNTS